MDRNIRSKNKAESLFSATFLVAGVLLKQFWIFWLFDPSASRLCLDLILELEIVMDTFGAKAEETLQKRWNIVMKTACFATSHAMRPDAFLLSVSNLRHVKLLVTSCNVY